MNWNAMIEPRNVDQAIAARFGLYHFGLVSAVGLIGWAVHAGRCTPSRMLEVVFLFEFPGIALDNLALFYASPGLYSFVRESIPFGVAFVLHAFAINSILYAVVLYAFLCLARRLQFDRVPVEDGSGPNRLYGRVR